MNRASPTLVISTVVVTFIALTVYEARALYSYYTTSTAPVETTTVPAVTIRPTPVPINQGPLSVKSSGAFMAQARFYHTATLLKDGRVLIIGGFGVAPNSVNMVATNAYQDTMYGEPPLDSCEIYDPAKNAWFTTRPLPHPLVGHTATLLKNGMVLVAGGFYSGASIGECWLFDPQTQTWTPTGGLNEERWHHHATFLADQGKVLVTGGINGSTDSSYFHPQDSELYDPATGIWAKGSPLGTPRHDDDVTALPKGRVFMCGGKSQSEQAPDGEIFDPTLNKWTLTPELTHPRMFHTCTALPDGRILVTGGYGFAEGLCPLAVSEIYDPANPDWKQSAFLATPRGHHTATLLPNGLVLVVGGRDMISALNTCELFDPKTEQWSATGSLVTARSEHTTTLLANGKVLVVGGHDSTGLPLNTCELYDPATGKWTGL